MIQGDTTTDLWLYDLVRQTWTRLTSEKDNTAPVWSPDGRRVAFSSNRAGDFGLYGLSAEGGEAERLTIGSSWWELSQAWSPDGRALAFSQQHGVTGHDLWVLPLEGERRPKPFLITRFAETGAVFSPDGRYLAYHSDESGRMDVYVRPSGPGTSLDHLPCRRPRSRLAT